MPEDTKICRFCGETIKAVAVKCRFCGEFINDGFSDIKIKLDKDSTSPKPNIVDYGKVCPKCGSNQVQKVSLIYSSGTFNSMTSSTTLGVGDIDDSLAYGIAGTMSEGKQQSLLAQILTPPSIPEDNTGYAGILIIILIGVMLSIWWTTENHSLFLLTALFLLVIALSILIILIAFKRKDKRLKLWEAQMIEWERKWFCNKCGAIFE